MNEYETSHGKGVFLTLTYNQENYPDDDSLHVEELQKFFKRLRKQLGKHRIKYFACGEYGEHTHRAHYHAIVFGLSVLDASILMPDVWTKGFFKIMPVYYESCRYVCNYVMKKYNGDKAKEEYGERQIPFQLASQGLGKKYALTHRKQITENNGVTVGGINKGFPKYYQTLYMKSDMSDLADAFTNGDIQDNDWKECVEVTKKNGFAGRLVEMAKENKAKEIEKYNEWLKTYNPDEIDEKFEQLNYDTWIRGVRKLRDLSIKAKCKLHDAKKRGL